MHFVYQMRDIVRGKRKQGKMLDKPIIHIMDGDKAVCGLEPSGARLLRLTDEQMQAWLFSRENSGSFSADMCYTCLYWIDTRIRRRGSSGVPEIVQEVAETLGGKLLP